MKEFWNKRYKSNPEKGSGPGSRGEYALKKQEIVRNIIKEKEIKSVLDLGCGDLYWIKDLNIQHYTGVDYSDVIIERNKQLKPEWNFMVFDFSKEDLDLKADLVLLIDVLIHQREKKSYLQVWKNTLNNAKRVILVSSWEKEPVSHYENIFFHETIHDLLKDFDYKILYKYRESALAIVNLK